MNRNPNQQSAACSRCRAGTFMVQGIRRVYVLLRVSGYTPVPGSVPSWTPCAGLRAVPAQPQYSTASKAVVFHPVLH